MASSQRQKGFTKLPNELFDRAILKYPFTYRELKVLLVLIRYINGFNKEETNLSLRFISRAAKIHFQHVSKVVKDLESKNIIHIVNHRNGNKGRILAINKDYTKWIDWKKNCSQESDSSPTSDTTVPKTVTEIVPNSVTKKDNNKNKLINTYNKSSINSFEDIIFPLELLTIGGFKEAFNDWYNYRKENKKPITKTVLKKQLEILIDFYNKGQDIIKIIDNSIQNSWNGFFEIKKPFRKQAKGTTDVNEYENELRSIYTNNETTFDLYN